jgi:hypothetical protein
LLQVKAYARTSASFWGLSAPVTSAEEKEGEFVEVKVRERQSQICTWTCEGVAECEWVASDNCAKKFIRDTKKVVLIETFLNKMMHSKIHKMIYHC